MNSAEDIVRELGSTYNVSQDAQEFLKAAIAGLQSNLVNTIPPNQQNNINIPQNNSAAYQEVNHDNIKQFCVVADCVLFAYVPENVNIDHAGPITYDASNLFQTIDRASSQ